MRADPILPVVFTRDDALAAGMSRHQIAHRVRTGGWRALRRGVYIQERQYAVLSVREQHTAAVVATLMARPEAVVATHLSAALGPNLTLRSPPCPHLMSAPSAWASLERDGSFPRRARHAPSPTPCAI